MSSRWSRQEREDLLDYQSSLNALIEEEIITHPRGARSLRRAMAHTRFQRHEELTEDMEAPVQPEHVDLLWLFEQEEHDRYAAYLFWLREWFGSWDKTAAYLGITRRAAIRAFKARAPTSSQPPSSGPPSSASR